MSLSLLLALTTCPALMGTQEAIRDSQRQSRREEYRAKRCNLIVSCVAKPSSSSKARRKRSEVDGGIVVLRDNKLYIDTDTNTQQDDDPDSEDTDREGNEIVPFTGYFLPYPSPPNHEGLVTTTHPTIPILNWIYLDKDTYQLKHGTREAAEPHISGPFDWTSADRRLTLEGWEGFVAVELKEDKAKWGLYFDRDDDGLKGKVAKGTRVVEVELIRREKRGTKKDAEEKKNKAAVSLEEKMAELKEERRKLEEEEEETQSREDGQPAEKVGEEPSHPEAKLDKSSSRDEPAQHAAPFPPLPETAAAAPQITTISAPQQQLPPARARADSLVPSPTALESVFEPRRAQSADDLSSLLNTDVFKAFMAGSDSAYGESVPSSSSPDDDDDDDDDADDGVTLAVGGKTG